MCGGGGQNRNPCMESHEWTKEQNLLPFLQKWLLKYSPESSRSNSLQTLHALRRAQVGNNRGAFAGTRSPGREDRMRQRVNKVHG